jgi:hypothetical protein
LSGAIPGGGGPIRSERPLNVSGELGFPVGLGVGASFNVNEHASLDASLGSMLLVEDLSVGGTYYPLDGAVTPTIGARAHVMYSNLAGAFGGPQWIPGASARIGVDYSADNGFQLGAYAGALAMRSDEWKVVPEVGISIGFRFP